LGERLLCKQEVIGSNPFTSTTAAATTAAARPRSEKSCKTPPGSRLMPGAGC
jgi:hypothetical protein